MGLDNDIQLCQSTFTWSSDVSNHLSEHYLAFTFEQLSWSFVIEWIIYHADPGRNDRQYGDTQGPSGTILLYYYSKQKNIWGNIKISLQFLWFGENYNHKKHKN